MLVIGALALAVTALVMVIALDTGGSSGPPGKASLVRSSDHPKNPYYVVRPGDSFSTIAAKEGIGQALIRRLNPTLDPLAIQPSNCIDLVPNGCRRLAASHASSSPARSPPAPQVPYYVVRPGDSLATIAANEGLDLARIERVNPNLHPDSIQPGNCVALVPHGCSELAARNSESTRSRALARRELLPSG